MRWFRRAARDDVDVLSFLENLGRLDAVVASGLIGAPASERLDDLTRIAAERLHAPMAFMSVLDDRHSHYASVHDRSGTSMALMLPDEATASYCQHVVASDDTMVVSDARSDDRTRRLPGASEIRSYLGVPIRYQGRCLGAFCVVDVREREWSTEDIIELQELAAAAMAELPR